jgi:hypothetical protein
VGLVSELESAELMQRTRLLTGDLIDDVPLPPLRILRFWVPRHPPEYHIREACEVGSRGFRQPNPPLLMCGSADGL